jgi:polyphosphate kinase
MGKTLRMKKLLHAPFTLKKGMLDMIARETQFALDGKPAHIIAKFNSLTDPRSSARCTRPASRRAHRSGGAWHVLPASGHSGVSHNIHVRSIIGRFLEHTRVFYFLNGGEEQIPLQCRLDGAQPRQARRDLLPGGRQELLRVKKELEGYLTDNTQAGACSRTGATCATRRPATRTRAVPRRRCWSGWATRC